MLATSCAAASGPRHRQAAAPRSRGLTHFARRVRRIPRLDGSARWSRSERIRKAMCRTPSKVSCRVSVRNKLLVVKNILHDLDIARGHTDVHHVSITRRKAAIKVLPSRSTVLDLFEKLHQNILHRPPLPHSLRQLPLGIRRPTRMVHNASKHFIRRPSAHTQPVAQDARRDRADVRLAQIPAQAQIRALSR